jgi:hypothetical protein
MWMPTLVRDVYQLDSDAVMRCFEQWIEVWDRFVRVHPCGPVFLLSPHG